MPRAAPGRRLRSRAAAALCALCALAGPLRRAAAEDFGEAAAARSGVYAARLPAFNTHIPPPGGTQLLRAGAQLCAQGAAR
jgi:hypothetical protein